MGRRGNFMATYPRIPVQAVTSLDYAISGEPAPSPAFDDARAMSLFRVALGFVVLFPLLAGIVAAAVAVLML